VEKSVHAAEQAVPGSSFARIAMMQALYSEG